MTTYITTPIYYVNAQPHLGHAYTTVVADTYSRFRRLCGDDVRFQTGTDEHGDKIVEAAEKNGEKPKEYVDRISGMFRDAWPIMGVEPDNYIRTTDVDHIATVQKLLQQVYDKGDIYFDQYTGLYCTGCERFLTEKELVEGKCPDHQTAPDEIAEQNYFFRMSKYQQTLIDHINDNPEFITPERYKNEVLSFLSEPLEDLCISRPKSRLTWGIELPFDENFVTYVWFDALINYLTGLGYPDGDNYNKFWPVAEHVIAKDILKPHAIFWPTMLLSMEIPLYQRLHVHGYWNVDNTKMSKSIGNVVRPKELVDAYGLDPLRYFTLREMSFGLDSSFSSEAIVARRNSDLANDLGNLYSRSTAMIKKYRGGVIPEYSKDEADNDLLSLAEKVVANYKKGMNDFQFHKALASVWELIGYANKYIVTNEPWALAKDESQSKRLDTVLYNLAECLRLLSLLVRPVMADTSDKMVLGLGLDLKNDIVNLLPKGEFWGAMTAGTELGESLTLFPRIEEKKQELVKVQKSQKPKKEKNKLEPAINEDGLVSFADFQKFDLRVAEVVAAEKVKKSDRLLKLSVKLPEERVIVAGIAEHYSAEEMVGKKVIVVANLKPAKLMGVTSQGMVLAAKTVDGDTEKLVLAGLQGEMPVGAKVA
ncbi:MAG: methionine--tRNA ligase [Desulfotalea sp.]